LTKITQTMLLATGIVFVVGAATWLALGGPTTVGRGASEAGSEAGDPEEPAAPAPPDPDGRGDGRPIRPTRRRRRRRSPERAGR
jgi:hypothetical protein